MEESAQLSMAASGSMPDESYSGRQIYARFVYFNTNIQCIILTFTSFFLCLMSMSARNPMLIGFFFFFAEAI